MAKFTTIKCWQVSDAITDPQTLTGTTPNLSVVKKSILKHGYRGYVIGERDAIESQPWYAGFLLGDEVRFYIDGSGVYRLVNCDLTDNEVYFERLNVPIGFKPWVFYSWQSDFNPSRSHIKDALTEAIKHINSALSPRQPLELVESTRAEDGAKDIVEAIKKNIDQSMIAIFDVTNVAQVSIKGDGKETATDQKCYPNANVIFELSYALSKKRLDQVILVEKSRKDEFKADAVPFDFEHNKRIDYDKSSKIAKDLREILIGYFKRCNFIQDRA